MGTWESVGTPGTSKYNCRGQNTSHWGVLYIIRKLSKCKCRKWARMSHLDICSTSYGKKKDRESNWQFDSRPLKVGNWPDLGACRWSATCRWKALNESYKFASYLIPIRGLQRVMTLQSGESPNWDNFGTPPSEFQDKKSFGCRCRGEAQRMLYGGRWWLPPNPGCGESCESKVARGLS
jgi:hypothetical protein